MSKSTKAPPDPRLAGRPLQQLGCGELVEYMRRQNEAARRRHGLTGEDEMRAEAPPRRNLWQRLVRWWTARS